MVAMAAFRRCDADIVILFIEFGVRSSHVEFCESDISCLMMLELTTLSYLASFWNVNVLAVARQYILG